MKQIAIILVVMLSFSCSEDRRKEWVGTWAFVNIAKMQRDLNASDGGFSEIIKVDECVQKEQITLRPDGKFISRSYTKQPDGSCSDVVVAEGTYTVTNSDKVGYKKINIAILGQTKSTYLFYSSQSLFFSTFEGTYEIMTVYKLIN